jgi:uncharacterized RDD family membrane protein YckC
LSQLVTGEAVTLDLRTAALPSRIVAGLLDALVQLVLLGIVGGIATAVSIDVSTAAAAALGIVVLVLVLIVYPVAFETLLRGRTPGKAALGLRVVRDDGGPIGFRQALVRGLAGAFLERFGLTLFLGAIVTMLLNSRNKRIGDLLAGTVVLQERVAARGGALAEMPPPLEGWAAGLDLARLPDGLALSARQFVARSDQLTDAAREELGGRLVQAVTDAVGAPPPGTPGWAVLAAVLAERRRRETERLAGPARTEPLPPTSEASPPPPAPSGFAPPG